MSQPTKTCDICGAQSERLAQHRGSKYCTSKKLANDLERAGKVRVKGRFAAWLARTETIPDFGVERAETRSHKGYASNDETWAPAGTAEFLNLVGESCSASNKDLFEILLRWANEPELRDGIRSLVNLGGPNALPQLLNKPVAVKAPPVYCKCAAAELKKHLIVWDATARHSVGRVSSADPRGAWGRIPSGSRKTFEADVTCPVCRRGLRHRPAPVAP